ncbi:hypothetical protein SME02_004677 [Klebsiella aerogenes]|nr:hypothetical protein [Klebsiella aerogenes]ELY3087593.1 hypothetical protein [Klebsiella aerogenes]
MNEMTLNIALFADSETAPADGVTPFRVHAVVTDAASGDVQPGIDVLFTVNKSACFDGQVNTMTEVTNTEGVIHMNIYNTVVETVTLVATSDDGVQNTPGTIDISFTEIAPLSIARVYNTNKTFNDGEPTIAWTGASLRVETEGGSGDITWKIESAQGVEMIHSDNTSAEFYFTEYAEKETDGALIAIDNRTGVEVRHTFRLSHFFTSYGIFANRNPAITYPELETFQKMFAEWGDIRAYENWALTSGTQTNTWYWFNEPNNQGLIDLFNGSIGYSVTGIAGVATE